MTYIYLNIDLMYVTEHPIKPYHPGTHLKHYPYDCRLRVADKNTWTLLQCLFYYHILLF
jgi:hypothetical protein